MGSFLKGLESVKSVECVFMRYDFSKPGKNITVLTIISDGVSKEVDYLTQKALKALSTSGAISNYQVEILDLKYVLTMKDGMERNKFRMNLSDLYSAILFDRCGYFTKLKREIIYLNGPLGQINEFESLGELEVEKEAPILFSRTLNSKQS